MATTWGGTGAASSRRFARSPQHDVGLTGLGIEGDLLFGPGQVRAAVDEAAAAGVDATYRELASIKGHDAFLTEWGQLTHILSEALASGIARAARRGIPQRGWRACRGRMT